MNCIFPEIKCKECGKMFIKAVEHQFRIGDHYFCKWTCYKHYKERHPQIGSKRSMKR